MADGRALGSGNCEALSTEATVAGGPVRSSGEALVIGATDTLELDQILILGSAAGVIQQDRAGAEQWFDVIVSVHQESGADDDRFAEGITAARGDVSVEQVENFLAYVAENGGAELVAKLAALGTGGLLAAYDEISADAPAAAMSAEDYWSASVAEYGSGWADFAGTEESWVEHRDRFYSYTNAYDPAAYAAAYEKLNPLNSMPMANRVAALQSLGFPVSQTPRADPWAELIAAHGGDWVAFTGSEPSWTQCRDQFYRDANAIGPQLYAAVYERLNALEGQPMEQRTAVLRELGCAVPGQPAGAAEQTPAVVDGTGMSIEDAARLVEQGVKEAIG